MMDNSSPDNVQIREFVERLKTVTGSRFFNYMNYKQVKTTCLMCGHNGRQVIDETNYTTAQDRLDNKPPRTFVTFYYHTPGIPADSINHYYYRLICDNCGFVTQHSARYVINWLDEEALREQHLSDAEWVNMPEPATAEPDEE
ncbi:hypothetical protein Q4R72_14240 [Morganella morganii]